jgi:pimeloyl-ACP methyl ester carboxylesterase
MWKPVTSLLPQYHCIAVDLPQHGRSKAIGSFTMPFAAEKVAELIDYLSPDEPVHLADLSEGAQVVVQMLASHTRVIKSAFISRALLPVPGAGIFASKWAARWAFHLAVKPFKNWDYWIRLNMKYAAGIPEQYFAHFNQDFQNITKDAFANLMAANQRFRLPEGLQKTRYLCLSFAGVRSTAPCRLLRHC